MNRGTPVAQRFRASVSKTERRGFESCRGCQFSLINRIGVLIKTLLTTFGLLGFSTKVVMKSPGSTSSTPQHPFVLHFGAFFTGCCSPENVLLFTGEGRNTLERIALNTQPPYTPKIDCIARVAQLAEHLTLIKRLMVQIHPCAPFI